MRLAISEQALVFCYSALLGAIYGVGYDLVRLARQNAGKRKALCLLADAVYVLVSCLVLLGFVLTVANGQMRWYVLLGVFLGGMLYASVLEPTVFRVLSVVSRALSRFLHLLGQPIHRLFRGIYHLMLRVRNGHRKRKTKPSEQVSGRKRKGEILWHRKEKNASGSSRG